MAYTIPSWTKLLEAWNEQRYQIKTDKTVNDIQSLERYGYVKFIDTYIEHLNSISVNYEDNQKADILAGVMLTVRHVIGQEYHHLNPKGGLLNKGSSVFRALDAILKPEDPANPIDIQTSFRVYDIALESFANEVYEKPLELQGKKPEHKFVIRDDREGKKEDKEGKPAVIFDHIQFCSTLILLQSDAKIKNDAYQNDSIKKAHEAAEKAKKEEERRAREEALKAKGGNAGFLSSITGGVSHMLFGGGKASASSSKSAVAEEEFVPESGPS
ncbi:hypothetical protein [Legionella sp. 16cNR16C]|uniref:hypothetical protein n=1 Tax=Legionella sp. 16cNR16C TaxID=2905656 RepID=UPI001E3B207C|nr:hypothetical protein [Legionella sp. 16cNR16C]MCE3045866.1 hypothetical protein [Legionella sp. 16cNR16C]